MVRLAYASLETNSENRDGFCTVLYYESAASREDIAEGLRYVRSHSAEFPDAPGVVCADDFDYKERPTALSVQAGWCRYECYGDC